MLQAGSRPWRWPLTRSPHGCAVADRHGGHLAYGFADYVKEAKTYLHLLAYELLRLCDSAVLRFK